MTCFDTKSLSRGALRSRISINLNLELLTLRKLGKSGIGTRFLAVEAAGIEPSANSTATKNSVCNCENCQQCRAASALHFECFKSHYLGSFDADLQRLLNSWNQLPASVISAVSNFVDRAWY